MQGSSFWKTVAIVGVIGIGSLAILEVQNQLGKQNLAQTGPSEKELADLVAAGTSGDSVVTAEVGLSDFEKMMAAADSGGDQLFAGSEPPLSEPPDAFDGGFLGSEQVSAQQNTPPVNNSVTTARLEQGGNPFGEQTEVRAVAANYSGTPSPAVEPVGFVSDQTFAADDGTSRPFQRGDSSATPKEIAEPEFSLFGSDDPAPTTNPSLQMPVADDQFEAAAPQSTNSLQFIRPNKPQENTAAQDDVPLPATVQFYEPDDAAPLRPTPSAQPPAPAFNDGALNRTPSLAPDLDLTPNPFQSSPNAGQDTPNTRIQPAAQEDFGSEQLNNNPFPEDSGTADPVPQPRDIQSPPMFPNPARDPQFELPVQPQPNLAPNNSLPPVDDANDWNLDTRSTIPELEQPGRSRIPDTDPSLISDPFPSGNTPGDRLPPGDMFPIDLNANESPRLPIPNLTQPTEPPATDFNNTPRTNGGMLDFDSQPRSNDGRREFNSQPDLNIGEREFNGGRRFDDGLRQPESPPRFNDPPSFNDAPRFNAQPRDLEITPRPDSLTFPTRPNFDSKPPMRDTRPADYDLSDRGNSGGVRTVSGFMSPNLVLEKTAPANATVGVPLEYQIFVRNEGDATAYEVVVEDEVPSGATVNGARPKPGVDNATNRMVWTFAQLQPNQTEEITVQLTPTGEGTLDGVATVKFKSRVRATTVITAPRLRIEMTGPEEVKLGDEVSYRYVITNEGSGEARDVFVRTLLPDQGGLKHPQGRDLEYEIGNMMPDQQKEIVLTVVAAEPGEYQAQAIVTGTGGAKDSAAWRTNIVGSQLQIVRRGPTRRFVGRPAVYENIVSNETNFDAVDARVVEAIPQGMDFKAANKGGKFDPQTRSVTWLINRLGPGRQEQLQIELIPTNAGQLESAVTIYENAGLQGENYVSTTVVEDLHNVGARMSQLDGPVEVGESFGFTITIDNRGTAVANEVRLVVDIPRQIEVIGAGDQITKAELKGDQVQYDMIVRIEPNARQTFQLKLRGKEPVRNGLVSAKIQYRQMEQPLVVSESVTVYRDF